MTFKSGTLLPAILSLLLGGMACLFSPPAGPPDVSQYHTPVDSAYKVIENLQLAYERKDIDRFMECLHPEFEFLLLETDWDDYTLDGFVDHSWGIDLEEELTGNMFASDSADVIELMIDGNSETVWYGDSTEVTLQP